MRYRDLFQEKIAGYKNKVKMVGYKEIEFDIIANQSGYIELEYDDLEELWQVFENLFLPLFVVIEDRKAYVFDLDEGFTEANKRYLKRDERGIIKYYGHRVYTNFLMFKHMGYRSDKIQFDIGVFRQLYEDNINLFFTVSDIGLDLSGQSLVFMKGYISQRALIYNTSRGYFEHKPAEGINTEMIYKMILVLEKLKLLSRYLHPQGLDEKMIESIRATGDKNYILHKFEDFVFNAYKIITRTSPKYQRQRDLGKKLDVLLGYIDEALYEYFHRKLNS